MYFFAMKNYFHLQWIVFNRRLTAFGLRPVAGWLLIVLVFLGLSFYLFYKTDFAEYVYLLSAVVLLSPLSERRRNDFLKITFPLRQYRLLRLLENTALGIPFVLFLVCRQEGQAALALLAIAALMAFLDARRPPSFTMPTPFSGRPFEFAVGFRNGWWLIGLSYFLTVMAVIADNFNLGVFALLLIFLVSVLFLTLLEPEFYVWIFNRTPAAFLWYKIKWAVWHATVLTLPVLLVLGIFFFEHADLLIVFQLVGYVALMVMVVNKYAAYPETMALGQGILLALTIQFPPLALVMVPYFFKKAERNLQTLFA